MFYFVGDPARFHSFYIAVCRPHKTELSMSDFISLGRMGSNVRKTVVLCSVDDQGQVVYTSVQWTGISWTGDLHLHLWYVYGSDTKSLNWWIISVTREYTGNFIARWWTLCGLDKEMEIFHSVSRAAAKIDLGTFNTVKPVSRLYLLFRQMLGSGMILWGHQTKWKLVKSEIHKQ